MEKFETFGLKIGISSCLNVYMKICEYKKSRSFKDSDVLTIFNIFSKDNRHFHT